MKYAVKIMLSEDDWIYITEDTDNCFDLTPVLFDDKELAEEFADTWRLKGKIENVRVIEYGE